MSLDVALPVISYVHADRLIREGFPDIPFNLAKDVYHSLFSDLRRL
jgi:hypothetical protein